MLPYSDKPRDPVRALLAAYREADLNALIEYDALRQQQLPRCLCANGSRNAFRRHFKRLA